MSFMRFSFYDPVFQKFGKYLVCIYCKCNVISIWDQIKPYLLNLALTHNAKFNNVSYFCVIRLKLYPLWLVPVLVERPFSDFFFQRFVPVCILLELLGDCAVQVVTVKNCYTN